MSAVLLAVALAAPAPAPLGAYLGPGCVGVERVPAFEQWLGRPVARMLDFLAADNWASMASSAEWVGRCWRHWNGRLTLSLPMLPRDGKSTLAAGAEGAYDAQLRQVFTNLTRNGLGDLVIRIGWEFNADWYPWSARQDPQAWVAYYRRIAALLRAMPGGERLRFDWCPALHAGVASPEPAYPGDDVVDIIGADIYNVNYAPPGTSAEQRWQALRDAPFGLRWHQRFAAARGKPMSYPEWGTGTRPDGHGGGDDPVFMTRMTAWIASQPVAYHNYWDFRAPDYDAKLSEGRLPLAAAQFLKAYGGPAP